MSTRGTDTLVRCTAPGCMRMANLTPWELIELGWDIFRGLCPRHHTGYVARRPPLCPLCPSRIPVLLGIHYG